VTCVIRNVGTFSITDPIERKADGTAAQGAKGFNPPSLLSIATGAPYLHHGKARTLEELFSLPFRGHYGAGSANLWLNGPQPGQDITDRDNLIAFLKSIDDSTTPFTIDPAQNACIGY
jgi:cytochrome c peroxidase